MSPARSGDRTERGKWRDIQAVVAFAVVDRCHVRLLEPFGAESDPGIAMNSTLRAVHPVLPARDVEESVRFFQKLRFSLIFLDSEDHPKYAALERDGVEIHLQWADESQWAYPTDRPAFRFVADDVDALFEEFFHAGVMGPTQPDQGPWAVPANTPWGTREFHLRDPAGSSLQFYQRA